MFESLKSHYKLTFLINAVLLLLLIFIPQQTYAQWPPFRLNIDPTYADGKITYNLSFRSRVDWKLSDVLINIPIPDGTRYLEATAPSSTTINYDGQEVSFFANLPDRGRIDAAFVVEVTNPEQTEFSTKAWIAWKGEQPGDYLISDVTIDTTERPLAWDPPARTRLDLDMDATATNETITYNIYVKNTRGNRNLRMWDLHVRVPIPSGTTFLSAEAPPPFVTDFDGREASFFVNELSAGVDVPPLRFRVSTAGVTDPVLVTHAWATWKNSSRRAVTGIIVVEETVSGNVVVQPHANQRVVSDTTGDVQVSTYDVTNVAFQDKGDHFDVLFYMDGALCPAEAAVDVFLFIDSDCRASTGDNRRGRGVEYELRYRHDRQRSIVRVWDEAEESWNRLREGFAVEAVPGSQTIGMSIPYDLIDGHRQFCWISRTRLRSDELVGLSNDWIPDGGNPRLSRFNATMLDEADIDLSEAVTVPPPIQIDEDEGQEEDDNLLVSIASEFEETTNENDDMETETEANVDGAIDDAAETASASAQQNRRSAPGGTPDSGACAAPSVETQTPATTLQTEIISGKLAVPMDNGHVAYDVHIFSLPEGQETVRIDNARQPNFRADGQRLLINREGRGTEDVYEYNLETGEQTQVSEAPDDSHPFYDPWGNRVVYGNSRLTVGYAEWLREESKLVGTEEEDRGKKEDVYRDPRKPFIFVQCGLIPPHQESEPRCQDMPALGKLVPASQMGEIVGDHPVWTEDDLIAFRGCNTWAGSNLCGIYKMPSSSTRGFSDGLIPTRLTDHTSDTPTDAKNGLIAFTSQRDGNWEAYIMNDDGTALKNLSNSPQSNDGLPTISPDGQWAAYVSDRGGQWAIWVVPATGGESRKLFDLPNPTPWGNGDRTWQNERISWGP